MGSIPSSKSEDSSITPPEAWGGDKMSSKLPHLRQPINLTSRLRMSSANQLAGSTFSVTQDSASSMTTSNLGQLNLLTTKDASSTVDSSSFGFPENPLSSSLSLNFGAKGLLGQTAPDSPLAFSRRFSTYAERISTASSFMDGTSVAIGSPKIKKTGAETKEELLNRLLSRPEISAASEPLSLPAINVSNYCFTWSNYKVEAYIPHFGLIVKRHTELFWKNNKLNLSKSANNILGRLLIKFDSSVRNSLTFKYKNTKKV